jgi:hypothetical protein
MPQLDYPERWSPDLSVAIFILGFGISALPFNQFDVEATLRRRVDRRVNRTLESRPSIFLSFNPLASNGVGFSRHVAKGRGPSDVAGNAFPHQ